jgi:diguanylate cyclase (GGDEF)-like protein
MRGPAALSDEHAEAIAGAYELIEIVQGQDDGGRVAVADQAAARHGWADVRVLLDFARSLAAREAGADDAAHVEKMIERATTLDDPALLALAWATSANRRTTTRRSVAGGESALIPLVRAIVLLDAAGGPVVHRAAALIEVAQVSHVLGFWELAVEHYDLAEKALAEDGDPRWAGTARRQGRAVAYNQVDLALDWACALAAVGDWAAAAAQAASALRSRTACEDWPPNWIAEHRSHRRLLAALAGVPSPDPSLDLAASSPDLAASSPDLAASSFDLAASSFDLAASSLDPAAPSLDSAGAGDLERAIRAARGGDPGAAAGLAAAAVDRLGAHVPSNAHLLALALATRHPDTPPLAIRYADELAALRWNNRLDRLAGVRDGISVERRRRDHEQLRRQVLVDDLTGLANRRGYRTYLDGVGQQPEDDGYAVLMIDVDHFKTVNDRFGHDTGDIVLARLGEILTAHVRPTDLAARLGGDEFVVILADVAQGVPELRAQAVIDAVRRHPWANLAAGLTVSISVGVHHGARRDLPTLLTDADRHLYHAKHHGRGRLSTGPAGHQ